jgi:proprotein convertase subtilisin/kexin type 5
LDVQNNPPVCIYCNTNAGLVYNPNNGTCTCASGFYLDSTKTFQCYACSALYCSICVATAPAQCTTCVVGAILNNVTLTCTCGNGFYVSGTQCLQCPYQCQNCTSPNGACATCVDPLHRDIAQSCKCVVGYFDSGAINCTSCSQTCLTYKQLGLHFL